MGFSLGGLFDSIVDPVNNFIEGTQKTGDQFFANIDDIWKDGVKQAGANAALPVNFAVDVASDPFDPKSYSKSINNWYGDTKKVGEDLFGDGGWYKGGADALGYATVGAPIGTMAYQGYDAATGQEYNGGKMQPAQSLYGLYSLGSNIYNASTTPTYNELGADGTSTQVTPTDYYGTDTANAASTGGSVTGYTEQGANNVNTDVNPYAYGQEAIGASQPVATTEPSFWENLGTAWNNFTGSINTSGVGKAAKTLDPTGLTKVAASTAENGNMGDLISGLGSLYKGYQTKKTYNDLKSDYDNQVSSALNTYAPGSAYATQLQKELDARDAAAGRRSQYGARSVELAAKLATEQAAIRKAAMSGVGDLTKLAALKANANNAGVSGLIDLYSKNYGKVNSAVGNGLSSLYDYFRGTPGLGINSGAGTIDMSNLG